MADLRQACDRCHDKKVRCLKVAGSPTCGRCAKAAVPCQFSPPTRDNRQPLPLPQQLPQQPDPSFDIEMDWQSMTGGSSFASLAFPQTLDEPEAAAPQPLPVSETAQLAELLVSLDGVYRDFDSVDWKHLSKEGIDAYLFDTGTRVSLQSTLEIIIQLAQKLATLYVQAVQKASLKSDQPEPSEANGENTNEAGVRPILASVATRPSIDHSIINLLLASHSRVLDTTDKLGQVAHICSCTNAHLSASKTPNFDIPEIRIGSFVAPKGVAASLIVSMIIEIHTTLLARCDLLSDLLSKNSDEQWAYRAQQALAMQLEAVRDRNAATLNNLKNLRDCLINQGAEG